MQSHRPASTNASLARAPPAILRLHGPRQDCAMIDFFEFSNEMLCLANHQGYFTRVNSAWTKTLGWRAEELTTRPYLDFVHPDDLAATIREAQLLSCGHETVSFENRYRCLDGSYRWLSWRVAPDKESGCLICTARDVTELRQQTDALREAERRFRTLATQAPVGIAQADAAGNVFFVNDRWCAMSGVTPAETLGLKWQEHIHPDDIAGLLHEWQSCVQAGRDMPPYEFRFLHRNGDVRWGSTTVGLLKNRAGGVEGQIAAVEDITVRKNTEIALREAEDRFRAFMDNTPTIAWAKDEHGVIVFNNKTAEELFHLQPGEWRGKTDYDYWSPAVAARLQANDQIVLTTGKPYKTVAETAGPDRETNHWMTILFPFQDATGRRLVGGIAIDITEMKRNEAEIQAKQNLLRNLIGLQENERQRLCHEFHDGLIQYAVGALMLIESYRRNHPEASDNGITAAIDSLRKGIEDGRRTIRGIRPAVLDDSDLKAAIQDLTEQFTTTTMTVDCFVDAEIGRLPETVQTTAYRVVQEALNNARKHSGTDRVRISLHKRRGRLEIEVRDYGCGYDVRAARKNGFGLQGMNERVRLLGGELLIHSEPGHGTTISVSLPILSEGPQNA